MKMRRIITIGREGNKRLTTAFAESNGTLVFDVSSSGGIVCSNLSVQQAREIRDVLSEFIMEVEEVTVTVTGPKSVIERIRKETSLKVEDPDW